jgi:ribosomal protein S3AE
MAIAKKRKKFFDVDMPLIHKTTQLYGMDEEELATRYIKYDLTRILRGKNAILSLKVVLNGKELSSIPKELIVLPAYMKRMVRKGVSYIEDSFVTETKDGKILIKPFLLTRRIVSKKIKRALRNKAREEIIEYSKDKNNERMFEEVLRGNIQKELSIRLKKIYPLSFCEIREIIVKK